MSKTKTFDFAKLAEEVRQAEEQKRLEDQATKLLLRFGIKADGRPRFERAVSVRNIQQRFGGSNSNDERGFHVKFSYRR